MAKRVFIGFFIFMFIVFIALYVIGLTGYFDYKQYEKMLITKDNMEQFELDIKEGKQVDIKDYTKEEKHDYNNSVSKAGIKLSESIEKYSKMIIGSVFKAFDKVVE